eukprot:5884468-Pleurochrysis_carterae.AAC.6
MLASAISTTHAHSHAAMFKTDSNRCASSFRMQEDANPIIDYIIKSHKYKQGKAKAAASSRPDTNALAQAAFAFATPLELA